MSALFNVSSLPKVTFVRIRSTYATRFRRSELSYRTQYNKGTSTLNIKNRRPIFITIYVQNLFQVQKEKTDFRRWNMSTSFYFILKGYLWRLSYLCDKTFTPLLCGPNYNAYCTINLIGHPVSSLFFCFVTI